LDLLEYGVPSALEHVCGVDSTTVRSTGDLYVERYPELGNRRQISTGGGTASNIIVVQNWFEELKRLVPAN
jgi:hypothetical protein